MIGAGSNLPVSGTQPPPYDMPFPQVDDERGGGSFTLTQLVGMVLARVWLSIGIFVILATVAFVVIKTLPKTYYATTTLIVSSENTDPLAGRNGIGTSPFFSTHVELLRNNIMLQPVVDRLGLKDNAEFTEGFEGSPKELNDMLLDKLRNMVFVQPGAGGQLLYIKGMSPDPKQAAAIANAVADEYVQQTSKRVNAPAIERATRYSAQLEELKNNVTTAQSRMSGFRKKHSMNDVKDGSIGELQSARLTDLQSQLLIAQNVRRQMEARRVDPNADNADVLEAEETLELRTKLGELEGELGQARATYGPRHPRILELQSQIEATRNSLQSAVRARHNSSELALRRARELEDKYQAAVTQERQRLMSLSGVQAEGAKLLLELQTAEGAYADALKGLDEVQFASQGNYQDVALVSLAEPPNRPASSNKVKKFAVALLASFALAVGGPFAYELFFSRRIRCRDDLERGFRILTLAEFGPLLPAPAAA